MSCIPTNPVDEPPIDSQNWSTTTCIHGVVSLVLFAGAVFFGDAASAGSTIREGAGHAIFFGSFFVVTSFPVFAAIGFALRRVFERRYHRPLPCRSALPWYLHLPLSLLFLASVIPASPEKLFRRYVADDVPKSLSEVHHWRTRAFRGSASILSYRIDPAEFGKVLSRYPYTEHTQPRGFEPPILTGARKGHPDFPIPSPSSPLIYEYTYTISGPGQNGLQVSHYASQNRDFVITEKWTN